MRQKLIFAILFGSMVYSFPQTYTPSPDDWSSQIIYFLMTDRFANGDQSNDNLGFNEYNPQDIDYYHGGDLKGLIEKLDYIKNLGATAIWITPQVKNQWLSPTYGKNRYTGFHGYWAQDFYQVDPHIGTLDDYKNFVREAHKKGLYVIQDIVCNHMGNFVSADGTKKLDGYPDSPAFPFADTSIAGNIFHYNGTSIYDSSFGGALGDLKTENPYVKKELINIFKYWIKEADIDGFRIDTVIYVEMDFWKDFCREIKDYAASLGKKDFIIFGEDYEYADVVNMRLDDADRKQAAYTGSDDKPIFNSMLDFSWCGAVTGIFAGSPIASSPGNDNPDYKSFAYLDNRYTPAVMERYTTQSRNRLVTFLDNHDMARFLYSGKANRDEKKAALALTALLTLPGLPCIYYGTEQAFYQPWGRKGSSAGTNNRQDLWESNYREDTFLYKYIAKIAALRKQFPALATGRYVSRIVDGNNGAIYSFSRILGDEEVLVVINRSTKKQTVTLQTGTTGKLRDQLSGKKIGAKATLKPQSAMILTADR